MNTVAFACVMEGVSLKTLKTAKVSRRPPRPHHPKLPAPIFWKRVRTLAGLIRMCPHKIGGYVRYGLNLRKSASSLFPAGMNLKT